MNRFTNALVAATVAIVPAFVVVPMVQGAAIYSFQTLNNNTDPTFNQLLGINTAGTIAGYFGSGSAAHPNQGYTLAPPYTQGSYTNENFPGSVQTQVVGINNSGTPTTVGFWVDANGNNFGFVDQNGTFTSVTDPNTPAANPAVNQLLGVNDNKIAAGFFVDGNGNANGYIYNIQTQQFTAVTLPANLNAVAVTATGINDAGIVTGFYVDANGATHGFIDNLGVFTSLDDPNTPMAQDNTMNTTILGLNNNNQFVGSYLDANGVTNGFVYSLLNNTWQTVNDPNGSTTAAFGVTGTTINGISDTGNLVGFYSDGTNVDGFLASSVPEPTTFGMASLGAALVAAGIFRKRKHS